jgi:hypothetical protein
MVLDPMFWIEHEVDAPPLSEWTVKRRRRKRYCHNSMPSCCDACTEQSMPSISGPIYFRELDVAVASFSVADEVAVRETRLMTTLIAVMLTLPKGTVISPTEEI